MKQPDELPPEQQEWQLLVDAYALGELDEAGMQRLYDLLRDDQDGASVAAMAWDSLNMRGTLRSALDPGFRDLIVDRIEQQDDDVGRDDRGFIGTLLAGIGLRRAKLDSVRIELPQRPRFPWPLLLIVLVLLSAAVLLLIVTGEREPLLVESVRGEVSSNGQIIGVGQEIGRSIVQVPDGGEIVVTWPGGQQARIAGAASFNANRQGLSLIEGQARLHSHNNAMTIGLPQMRINLESDSELVIEAAREHSTRVGLLLGKAVCENGEGGLLQLTAGNWSDGRQRHPWLRGESWEKDIPAIEGDWWSCEIELHFAAGDGQASFMRDQRCLLRCLPAALEIGEQTWPLPHAPRQSRQIGLHRRGEEMLITVDGQELAVSLPPGPCPDRLVLSDDAIVTSAWVSSGPGLIPAP